MDQIVASRWDGIGGDVVTDNLKMTQLGGRDEPGGVVRSEKAEGRWSCRYRSSCWQPQVPSLAIRMSVLVDSAPGAGKTWPMYAVVATVSIKDPEVAREALAGLRLNLVPRAPGFVSAYWLAPIDGIGMSVIVFETKEHAEEAVAYPLPPLPGVTPQTVEIREVYANA